MFYMVRVGNYATRPLRQVESDFRRLAATSGATTEQLNRLQARQRGLRLFGDFAKSAQFASGAVTVALGIMAHSAADFQTQVAQAATQVGNNFGQMQADTKRIMDGILQQMGRFPASSEEMAQASYDIYSSLTLQAQGADRTSQGMKVLDVANRAAVAGQTSLSDATSGIVVLLNTFAKGTQSAAIQSGELNKMLNTAFATVRFGRITFGEYTQALATTAPAAKSANQSLQDMSGTLAFLTRRMPVRQAAVSYARLLEVLQRSAKGLKRTGVDVRDASGQMRPLQQIIGQIVKENPRLVQGKKFVTEYFKSITKGAGAGTIGTIQARRGFVFLVQQFAKYRGILRQVNQAQGQFAESYEVMRKTAGVRWDVAMNRLRKLALEVGATVIPIFERMLEPVQRAVKWFNNLNESTKRHITTFVAWAAIGTLIVSTIGVIVAGLGSMVSAFTLLSGVGGIGVFGAIVAAGPEIAAAAVAVGALAYAFHRWPDETSAAARGVWNVVSALARIGIELGKLQIGRVIAPFRMAGQAALGLAGAFTRLVHTVTGPVRNALNWLSDKWNALRETDPVINWVVNISLKFAEGAFNFGKRVLNFLKGIPGAEQATKTLGGLLGVSQAVGTIRGVAGIAGRAFGIGGGRRVPGYVRELREQMGGPFGQPVTAYDEEGRRRRTRRQPFVERARGAWAERIRLRRTMGTPEEVAARAQVRHNAEMQRYVGLLRTATKYAEAHPNSLKAQIRLGRIRNQIEKKFGDIEASAIEQVASAERAVHGTTRQMRRYVTLLIAAERYARKHAKSLAAQLRLTALRNKMEKIFSADQISAIESVVGASLDGDKKRTKSHKDAMKQMTQANQEAINSMTSAWNDMYEANKTAFGNITEQPLVQNMMDFGVVPRFRDYMGDITSQITKFGDWRKELRKGRKLLPKNLMREVQAAGIEAEPFLAGLLQLTPKQRQAYVKEYQKAQKLIKQATDQDFRNRLKDWHGHGRKAALAFLNGMESEQSVINKRMKKIFLQWMKEVGAPVRPHHRPPRRNGKTKTAATARPRTTRKTAATHHTTHHNNYSVTVHQGKEDLSTTLRKARLAQKRKARRLHI
jgi:TP901 family phage tail tape measure protein